MALVFLHELVVVERRQRERNRRAEARAVDLIDGGNLSEDQDADGDCQGYVNCSEDVLLTFSRGGGGRVLIEDPALDQVDGRGQLQRIGEEQGACVEDLSAVGDP